MAAHSEHLEQLGKFLRDLPPDAQGALLAELERGLLKDDALLPAADFMLSVLQREIRRSGRQVQRLGNPSRLFFRPVEPFLVDDTSAETHRELISRPCLNPIWLWICHDLMPTEAKAYVDATKRALLAEDKAKSEKLAREFQDRAAGAIGKALSVRSGADHARERLTAFMGPPRAFDDMQKIVGILKMRDELAKLDERLPPRIADLRGEQLDETIRLLNPLVSGTGDGFAQALVLVKKRLVTPCQVVRLATLVARSNKLAVIAKTPYRMAIAVALSDLEEMVSALRKRQAEAGLSDSETLIKRVFDALNLMEVELNLDEDTPWGHRYAKLRAEAVDAVDTEIKVIPRHVDNLLQPRKIEEIIPESVLDSYEISRIEKALMFIESCRSWLGGFVSVEAIQQVCLRIKRSIDETILTLVGGLFEVGRAFRKFYQSQIETALRIAVRVFGRRYAAGITKTVEDAVKRRQSATE